MPITGSQKALMFAQSGVARCGATRSGYHGPKAFISIGGVHYGTAPATAGQVVVQDSLTITDIPDESANTCQFTARGFTPTVGQEVIITLGSKNNSTRMFAGNILTVEQVWLSDRPANIAYHVNAIDYGDLLNFVTITGRYNNNTASGIVADLILHVSSYGFTAKNVQAGLPVLDEITFTFEPLATALTRVAKRIGAYWYVDYNKDLHFFTTETGLTNPRDLTSTHPTLQDLVVLRDRGQIITRVLVEGGGANALEQVSPGDTILPLETVSWYSPSGGKIVSGPQTITYTGLQTGGGGSLVGPGASPSVAPSLALVAGSGLGTGVYGYAYTDITASGESLPSPVGSVTTGPLAAPNVLPTLSSTPSAGTGADPGVHL